jgi:hypothetical protein
MSFLLKLMKYVKARWEEASGAGRIAGGKIVGREQGIMRCDGSRRGLNGGSQQGDYTGADAGDRTLARDMADGTGRSRGRQCLDLYLMYASRPGSFGNKRIDFMVMELQDKAEMHLGQQRQPSESMQAMLSAQAHENPQMPSVDCLGAILALHFFKMQRICRGSQIRDPGPTPDCWPLSVSRVASGLFPVSSRRGPRPNLTRVNPLKASGADVILVGHHSGNGLHCALVS